MSNKDKTLSTIYLKIKAGYYVTIVSWENDADHYNTKVVHGLYIDDAKFVVEFAKLFYSRNNPFGQKGYGNMYEPSDSERNEFHKAVRQLINEHPHQRHFDVDANAHLQDDVMEFAYDLGLTGGDYYTRVCDSIKVEFIPQDVHMDDVTAQFV